MKPNLTAESIILAQMMSNEDAFQYAIEKLDPSDFVGINHQVIFGAMLFLFHQGKAITPEALYHVWENQQPGKGDIGYLYGISLQVTHTSSNIETFVDSLKKDALLRKMHMLLVEKVQTLQKNNQDPHDIYHNILKDLETTFGQVQESKELIADRLKEDYQDSGMQYLEWLKERRNCPSRVNGIETKYPMLDSYIDGLNKGHYIIVGARPGIGKTTFILNLIRKLVFIQNIPIGFFSLEMTYDQFIHNLICQEAGVQSKPARQGKATVNELEKIEHAVELAIASKIYFDDRAPLSISQISTRTRNWINRYGIKALFIDYLGEIHSSEKFPNRQEEMQHVSKSLRNLAKNLKIPIICIAQLNRESEKAASRPPIKADLRESGQIEADAHTIILLHRPEADKAEERILREQALAEKRRANEKADPDFKSPYDLKKHHPQTFPTNLLREKGNLELHIVKNRFGNEGVINMVFKKETGEIEEVAWNENIPEQ